MLWLDSCFCFRRASDYLIRDRYHPPPVDIGIVSRAVPPLIYLSIHVQGCCIVQSYLLWLNDSDYSPLCQLCNQSLADKECIRLLCYHVLIVVGVVDVLIVVGVVDVFHWSCLDNYARRLPAHTAPAGYSCPTCQAPMFPPSNMVSPVADVLRSVLAGVNWARAGLGLPVAMIIMVGRVDGLAFIVRHQMDPPHHRVPGSSHRSSANYDTRSQTESLLTRRRDDRDENKYRRKSPFELLHHWLSTRGTGHDNHELAKYPFLINQEKLTTDAFLAVGPHQLGTSCTSTTKKLVIQAS
ncbi:ZFPL1 [Cordylochernes scorpioides]|uniref:Zinc finger protein-like 1 homolog n=1 Tax=Cordylochernes scorpioides TaxID=51811 RepID=A0ABY6LIJ7_9ARAC|nr:ZFPL1 [Cordylochernes scorpioides]